MTKSLQHVKSVVFDWAGTMVDHGSLAPMGVFVEAFRRFGLEITIEEARGPWGWPNAPTLPRSWPCRGSRRLWRRRAWTAGRRPMLDIDAVYEVFVPMNVEVAARYADLVPGRGFDGPRA